MAIIRLSALEALRNKIALDAPGLEGNICVGQADPGEELEFPSLAIKPIRWTYDPHQADEFFVSAPDRVVVDVGAHEAEVQLILGAKTAFKRYELEQEVIDIFLGTPMQPGILNTPVIDCKDKLGEFVASWELETDQWGNEAAFDQEFFSTIIVTGIIPALVTRRQAYRIEQLQLGLSEDFNVVVDETTFNTLPQIDVVKVNQDGTFTPL